MGKAPHQYLFAVGGIIQAQSRSYETRAQLGWGGMSEAYLVKDRNIGRPFVMKLLHPDLLQRAGVKEAFDAEARAVAALHHPHIVEVFDLGELTRPAGVPYYLMELLYGETVRDALLRRGELSMRQALRITEQLLLALDHAHKAGVVHRDVKPDNVFLHTVNGAPSIVKLIDFGILCLISHGAKPGTFVGTPRYAAPEQLRLSKNIGPQSDIYSVGVMLFEMLTGLTPFDDVEGTYEGMRTTVGREAPSLRHYGGEYPPRLIELVAGALAQDPEKRPHDAGVLARKVQALRLTLGPEPGNVTEEIVMRIPMMEVTQITPATLGAPTEETQENGIANAAANELAANANESENDEHEVSAANDVAANAIDWSEPLPRRDQNQDDKPSGSRLVRSFSKAHESDPSNAPASFDISSRNRTQPMGVPFNPQQQPSTHETPSDSYRPLLLPASLLRQSNSVPLRRLSGSGPASVPLVPAAAALRMRITSRAKSRVWQRIRAPFAWVFEGGLPRLLPIVLVFEIVVAGLVIIPMVVKEKRQEITVPSNPPIMPNAQAVPVAKGVTVAPVVPSVPTLVTPVASVASASPSLSAPSPIKAPTVTQTAVAPVAPASHPKRPKPKSKPMVKDDISPTSNP
ncbi:MAG: serine/threonine protein kinase [Polyangiaceae bacterium]|nr:serine/threonine protein kinase [Polyangiaceae bacterium]